MYDLYEGLLIVDFYDTRDLESRLYKMLTRFSSPHVSLVLGEYTLLCPREGKPTGWYPRNTVDRLMGSSRTASFSVMVPRLDPGAAALLGEGHLISSQTSRIYHEIVTHYGLPFPRPRVTTCVGIITSILNMSGLPVKGSTAKELHDELRHAARICGSSCVVEEDFHTDHQHSRR